MTNLTQTLKNIQNALKAIKIANQCTEKALKNFPKKRTTLKLVKNEKKETLDG